MDAGGGIETSFNLRRYQFFLSALVARTFVHTPGGARFLVALRSYH